MFEKKIGIKKRNQLNFFFKITNIAADNKLELAGSQTFSLAFSFNVIVFDADYVDNSLQLTILFYEFKYFYFF